MKNLKKKRKRAWKDISKKKDGGKKKGRGRAGLKLVSRYDKD